MDDFSGKVAVVTGAAGGIGYAIAERLVHEGARVVLADVDAGALERACGCLPAGGADASWLRVDVSRPEDVRELAAFVRRRYGAVHILFNNAGVGIGGAIWEHSPEDWQWLQGVNVTGVANGLREFVPMMIAQGDGCHIVNTASAAGLEARAWLGLYAATKYAVIAISEALQEDLRLRGASIGVSVLCPALVNTGIADSERHRPGGPSTSVERMSTEAQAFDEAFRAALAQGLAPAKVADAVIDGIRAGRFYIVTNPETEARVRGRFARILRDVAASPVLPRGGNG